MEQELFFVFILLLVVCIVVFKFFNLKRNKFSLSQDHIKKLAEHMKTSADNSDVTDNESDIDSIFEDDDRTEEEKRLDIPADESTIDKCCKVDCDSCDFRTSTFKNPCNNPNILIDGVNSLLYAPPVVEIDPKKEELFRNLIPEPVKIKINKYSLNNCNSSKIEAGMNDSVTNESEVVQTTVFPESLTTTSIVTTMTPTAIKV